MEGIVVARRRIRSWRRGRAMRAARSRLPADGRSLRRGWAGRFLRPATGEKHRAKQDCRRTRRTSVKSHPIGLSARVSCRCPPAGTGCVVPPLQLAYHGSRARFMQVRFGRLEKICGTPPTCNPGRTTDRRRPPVRFVEEEAVVCSARGHPRKARTDRTCNGLASSPAWRGRLYCSAFASCASCRGVCDHREGL